MITPTLIIITIFIIYYLKLPSEPVKSKQAKPQGCPTIS